MEGTKKLSRRSRYSVSFAEFVELSSCCTPEVMLPLTSTDGAGACGACGAGGAGCPKASTALRMTHRTMSLIMAAPYRVNLAPDG